VRNPLTSPLTIWIQVISLEQTSFGATDKTLLKAKTTRARAKVFYPAKPSFRRRHNGNGVIDSICCECLSTVASAHFECVLVPKEEAHVCDPVRASLDPSTGD
jgi:hypothetical protein